MAEKDVQQTAESGQMAPQQPQRPPTAIPLHQMVYQAIINDSQTTMAWQLGTSANERMGLTMDLISNISLAVEDIGHVRAAELGCGFEQEMFHKSPSKEAYAQAMANKTVEFCKKRQENEAKTQSAGGTPSANSTS
ncbi:hypothetical protein E4U17_003543 [Claviceps sp. LM77 group G4]|nr:hypothetical protein E4U17_003543 [Claviceps sp. LM77 group G4]KAG6071879.1 hypothetical protein E4U33_003471 [Claviceps sp. LM78 group G4]KAG6079917.1 hypothetical protein E4U16_000713 [Claviceps sp. LM84 group G4]